MWEEEEKEEGRLNCAYLGLLGSTTSDGQKYFLSVFDNV